VNGAFSARLNHCNRASLSEHQGDKAVENIEHMELDAHRSQINADVKSLVEKYRSNFDWDIPEIDQDIADKFILAGIRKSLDDVETDLL
jgi:hypothetical protein